jgi:hypothetical protein
MGPLVSGVQSELGLTPAYEFKKQISFETKGREHANIVTLLEHFPFVNFIGAGTSVINSAILLHHKLLNF